MPQGIGYSPKRRTLGASVSPTEAFRNQTPGPSYRAAQRRAATQPDYLTGLPGVSRDLRNQPQVLGAGFTGVMAGNRQADLGKIRAVGSALAEQHNAGYMPTTLQQRQQMALDERMQQRIPQQQFPQGLDSQVVRRPHLGESAGIERGPHTGGAQIQQLGAGGPQTQAMQQLGSQNLYGIQSDPRYVQMQAAGRPLSSFQLDAPAANRHRELAAADPSGPFAGMSGAYSQQRLLNTGNALGLARTPTIEGGNVADVAYRPGAPGSSPFVSDGPLSERYDRPVHGQELQGRLGGLAKELGGQRSVLRSEYQVLPHGGVRVLGPQAQAHRDMTNTGEAAIVAGRHNITTGVPTTLDAEGEVVARNEYQQRQSDIRRGRTGDLRDFREDRRILGQRRLGNLPSEQDQAIMDEDRAFQQQRRQLGLTGMEQEQELARERVAIERQQAEAAIQQAEAGMANARNQQEWQQFQRERETAQDALRNSIGQQQADNDTMRARAEAGLNPDLGAGPPSQLQQLGANAASRGLEDADVGQALMSANNMSPEKARDRVRELSRIPAAMRTDEQQAELDALEAATRQPGWARMTDPWGLRDRLR
jgi:hypothetical protein